MADEKKPKIDLKARLGKASTATPPPGTVIPVPVPKPTASRPPPPGGLGGGLPGVPIGPPSPFGSQPPPIDPSNPLAAVAQVYRPPPPSAPAPPQMQRIEVDEVAVHQARRGANKQAFVIAVIVAIAFTGLGYVAGDASQVSQGRAKSKTDAQELSTDVKKAGESLKVLADKLEAGRNTLTKDHKFPDTLSKDLGGINIDFDGSKLAGRRFSSFSPETSAGLVEFITAVQALNDRKLIVQNLLTKLQKPLTEQLNAPPGQSTINYVVVVDKDPGGNSSALLAAVVPPIVFTPPNLSLPAEFAFANPLGQGNAKLPAYKGGDISSKPAAMYLNPRTFEKACPSEISGQTAQLAAQIGNVIHDVRGDGPPAADAPIADTKDGLLQRVDKLIAGLDKIKN
ncbi:MAG: hypothetical protein ABIP39_02640 [Polyangiaceae bacterium]